MKVPAPFTQRGQHLQIELGEARALFTTRRGGVSEGAFASLNLGLGNGDSADRVGANRSLVAGLAGSDPALLAFGQQVHGHGVRRLSEAPDSADAPAPADGQATNISGVAPIVLTADCLPIALASQRAVAMVHAGWRGLADGVIDEGVSALRELGGGGTVRAAIGPGAGRCCYEVGDELRAVFAELGDEVLDGRSLDLKLIARRRLEQAGIEIVHDVELCTICADSSLFFSYRRDGSATGRQAGVAWLR